MKNKVIASALIFSACNVYAANISDLKNKEWIITDIKNVAVKLEEYSNEKPNIKFSDMDRFNAWAGCNRITGSYTFTEPNLLTFGDYTIMTKMACINPENIEDIFVAALPQVEAVNIDPENLQFMDHNNNVIVKLKVKH